MPRVKVSHGHVKLNARKRVGLSSSKTAGRLKIDMGEPDTNLGKLRSSLKALSISGKKPKYISF